MADGTTSTIASASTAPRNRVRRAGTAALLIGTAALALAGAGAALAQAGAAGGTAVYWMTADTTSGMGSMMAGGGGSAAMLQAMMGRGGGQADYAHLLSLQLGSPRKAAGEPSAEHLVPPGLRAGPSLPLVTPQRMPPVESGPWHGKMEKPKGRLLIYWGCGDRARPGQPVVIDFESMMAGKMPPAFATVRPLMGPAAGRYATYGEWPNQRSAKPVPAEGSLIGDHVVRGNYSPEIKFSLAPGQDFLAPVMVSGNEAGPSGSVPLAWRPVAGAKAWFVATMGAAQNGDMVMWSSSETQAMPMMMAHLAQDEIARLVASKVLLPASATRCTVPAEVAKASQSGMLTTTAFGGEANFSHPARPAKAPASWRPDWTVKLLTKSSYTGMLGMDMGQMMGGQSGADADGGDEQQAEAPQKAKKKKRNPFGGIESIGSVFGQ